VILVITCGTAVLCKLQSDCCFICPCVLCVSPAVSAQKLNEKLGYRRDNARRRSLRLSRSFKVISSSTSRGVCHSPSTCQILSTSNYLDGVMTSYTFFKMADLDLIWVMLDHRRSVGLIVALSLVLKFGLGPITVLEILLLL